MDLAENMIDDKIIIHSADFVKSLFRDKLPAWAAYHNLEHTIQTVETCMEMIRYYELSSRESEMVMLAAWFHDTGYINGPEDHEERSVEIASSFLSGNGYPASLLEVISSCIRKTKIATRPGNLLECIIRDADLISLGTRDFFRTNELLRKEFELREKISFDETEWLIRSEKFLSSHLYYTEYARLKLNLQFTLNLKELRRRLGIV